jgi:vancomycin resistance protein YoaR
MKRNFKDLFKLTIFLIFGIILTISFAYHLTYFKRIYPGVKIGGINLGNKTKEEAIKILAGKTKEKQKKEIILLGKNQRWLILPEEISLSYDLEKSVEKAYSLGRRKNFFLDLKEKIQAWKGEINLPLEYNLNSFLLEEKIEKISQEIFIPASEPEIKISGKKIIINPGENGQKLNEELLKEIINKNLSFLGEKEIVLPLIYLKPKLSPEEIEQVKKRAEKFLGKKIKIVFEDQIQILDEKEIINLLLVPEGFDEEKISSLAASFASTFNRPPQDAAFHFSEGKVTVFRPEKEGIKIDEEKLKLDLISAFEKIEKENSPQEEISISFEKIPPQIKNSDVNNLGIQTLLGQGISYFKGSIPSRIHNINLASSKINGLLVAPGEIFSFNKSLGEVSQMAGYKESYIIKEGKTVLGDGGGVCQVSTTLFRAALSAGLPIEERHPHAYRVSYYEQNSPPGFDATVWDPTADLKFKNDTPAYILIQITMDKKEQKLIADIYGTPDERVVEIGKPRIWDQVPPPPDLYLDDPTSPLGTIRQIDFKAWGAKVAFDWKVVRKEEILQKRTFYSNYRPWQAVYLKGTKQ